MKNKKSLSILRAHFVFQRDYHIDPTFIYLSESRATLCHDAQPVSTKCEFDFHLPESSRDLFEQLRTSPSRFRIVAQSPLT